MPGVADVRVLAAPDAQRGQQIVACIVADAGRRRRRSTVRRFCAARLAPHKIPRSVVFLDAIPLTARGKTDRGARALVRTLGATVARIRRCSACCITPSSDVGQ